MHKLINVGSGLIENEGKFLLVNANHGPSKGQWNNPGGKTKNGENFEQCAIREIFEETGFTVKLGKLLNTIYFDETPETLIIKKTYEAIITGGSLRLPKGEIDEAKWFTFEEIKKMDPLSLTYGAIKSISDYIEGASNRVYQADRTA